jgi:autotransporter-associated beta strand protein
MSRRRFWRTIVSVCVFVPITAVISRAQSLDGWGSDGGPGSPTLSSQSTFGVTLGSHALDSVNPQGGFWGPTTGNLIPSETANLKAATTLSFDLTLIGTQLNGGSPFSGFAQSNELAIILAGNNGAINLFIQVNFDSAGATDSLAQSGQWNGVDGTRQLTWNLTDFLATDPTTGKVEDVAQILQNNPGITDAKIAFVQQTGEGSSPSHFYFDDVQLEGPSGNLAGGLIGDFEGAPEPLTWNNTGGANPHDGKTWDINNNNNWNNGGATVYTDGASVAFTDANGGAASYGVTLNTTVNPGSVMVNNSAGNYTISGTGGIAGTGALTKMGSGMLTLSTVNTYSGGTNISAGKLVIGVNGALPNHSLGITGGTVQLARNTGGAQLTSLSISGGGVLDLENNHLVLTYGAGMQATADSQIRGYLIDGFAGGAWNGSGGINSSVAAATAGFGLGYADGANGVVAGLLTGQIEIKYTRYGDANLDGVVNGDDFTILVENLGKSVNGWDKGDFNYDGVVSGDDFTLLVGNIGKAANGADIVLPAGDLAAIDAFAAANGLMADVPEPGSVWLIAIVGVGILGRRRSCF